MLCKTSQRCLKSVFNESFSFFGNHCKSFTILPEAYVAQGSLKQHRHPVRGCGDEYEVQSQHFVSSQNGDLLVVGS